MNKVLLCGLVSFGLCGCTQAQTLKNSFIADAATIGKPAADGVSGIITKTGGSDYRVRSINGTWWMIDNADKPLTTANGCTYNSIDRGDYGHLYSWDCAQMACPRGWSLPTNDDFNKLDTWLNSKKWDEWNSGYALAGLGEDGRYYDNQSVDGHWWSSSSYRRWVVDSDRAGGYFGTLSNSYSCSVRCIKKQ